MYRELLKYLYCSDVRVGVGIARENPRNLHISKQGFSDVISDWLATVGQSINKQRCKIILKYYRLEHENI